MLPLLSPDPGPLLLVPDAVWLPDGPAEDHAVVVTGAAFTDVGPAARVLRDHPGLSPVRLPGCALLPGFVDAHHHLTQSFGSALAFGEPSEIFRRVWVPLEGALDEESAYVSAKLAAWEALRGGFTTVADAGTRAPIDVEAVASAARDAGLRCVLGAICNDADDSGADDVLARADKHLARYASDPLVHPSLAVSIPEAATEPTLTALARLAAEAGAVLQIHVNEHLAAVERSLVRHGLRPLEHLHRLGVLGPHLLAAHATLLTPRELALLRDTGTAVSYNPVASAWKGNAVAPALLMAEEGIRFGLGTDGTRGDAFRLLDAAETAQRLTHGLASGDSSCGGGWTWLDHGTRLGADAVGLGTKAGVAGVRTGVVSAGSAADFLLVDLTVPELAASHDLPWELLRRGNRDQITGVFTGGRLRLWHGRPLNWDGPALVARARELAADVVGRAPIVRVHKPSTEAAR
ncbi:S-adenosylhomocysteine deaminase [Streptomyces sp. Ru71]|uniref:amidohydrolase family protein n=1 Tax=Streptomyces sp. Ru71 TaxID=2080746 RepID=UPI000CDCE962|nr:amidohydrolase family protein [Streptomyces sp. Ru71]POX52572.1 S-adenosylhomocysteine deaminase [Streptomyces sp. Ru71]